MEAFITEIVVAVGGVVLFYARQWMKAKLSPAQLTTLLELARATVAASEKLGQAAGLEGPQKYEVAEQSLSTLAKRVGVRLKPEESNALIHAALIEVDRYNVMDVDEVAA